MPSEQGVHKVCLCATEPDAQTGLPAMFYLVCWSKEPCSTGCKVRDGWTTDPQAVSKLPLKPHVHGQAEAMALLPKEPGFPRGAVPAGGHHDTTKAS